MPIPVKFIKSAVHVEDYPDQKRPEIAIAGRSNAGKSSFLNALTNSKIAKVSQEPGKTRLLNFFDVGTHYRMVDMPGYGFAARASQEVNDWQLMVETYLHERENFQGLLLLMDSKREWDSEEQSLLDYMNHIGKPMIVVLTKVDRMKRQEIERRVAAIKKQSKHNHIVTISSQEMAGIKELENLFFNEWIKPHLKPHQKSSQKSDPTSSEGGKE